MTRAMTIVALTCFLVVGAAATSILGRDSVPMARFELASASVSAVQGPVSTRERKTDRLAVTQMLAAFEPAPADLVQPDPALNESLRRAYASTSPADLGMPRAIAPSATSVVAPAKPKVASKPQPQKNYALLSDIQIAGIKERLKLSSSQESYCRRWKPRCVPSPARFMRAGRPIRTRSACRSIPRRMKSSS